MSKQKSHPRSKKQASPKVTTQGRLHKDRSSRFWAVETAKRWLTSDGMIVQYAADGRDRNGQGQMSVGAIAFLDLATGDVYARFVGQTECEADISGCQSAISDESALLAWAGRVIAAKRAADPHAIWIFHVVDELVFGWRSLQARAQVLMASADPDTAAHLNQVAFDRSQVRRLFPLALGYKVEGGASDSRRFFTLVTEKFRLRYHGFMDGEQEAAACQAGRFDSACLSAQAKVRMFKAAMGVFASNPWSTRGWSMARQRLIDFIYSPLGFWGGVILAAIIGFNAIASVPESWRKLQGAFGFVHSASPPTDAPKTPP